MYLRFRSSQLSPPKSDNAFEELYRQLHGRLPEQVRPHTKPSFTVQIYLVRNQRINKKPTQIYIGVLANVKIYINEHNELNINNDLWIQILQNLAKFDVSPDLQPLLIKKVERYLEAIKV
ncbi:MAG: hypothetical protein M3Q99_09995 [Acidobacteriota bacterium]|nr:hypothetical protein [Acidobacteriota bacterium]